MHKFRKLRWFSFIGSAASVITLASSCSIASNEITVNIITPNLTSNAPFLISDLQTPNEDSPQFIEFNLESRNADLSNFDFSVIEFKVQEVNPDSRLIVDQGKDVSSFFEIVKQTKIVDNRTITNHRFKLVDNLQPSDAIMLAGLWSVTFSLKANRPRNIILNGIVHYVFAITIPRPEIPPNGQIPSGVQVSTVNNLKKTS